MSPSVLRSSRPTATQRPPLTFGKFLEHGRAFAGVVLGDDLADRLVIQQDTRRASRLAPLQRLAVDAHLVARHDPLADVGRLAVHRDPPGDDHLFHVAARTDAGIGEHLVQFFGLGIQRLLGRAPTALEHLTGKRDVRHRGRIDVVAVAGQRQQRRARCRRGRHGVRAFTVTARAATAPTSAMRAALARRIA